MLLSKAIVSRLNPKCYVGVTSTRLFSSVRKHPSGFEPKLFRTSYQMNICSSHLRLLSITGPKLSENNKEELIFENPEKPAETVPDSQEFVFTTPQKPAETVETIPDSQEMVTTIPEKPAETIPGSQELVFPEKPVETVETVPGSQELVFTIPEKPVETVPDSQELIFTIPEKPVETVPDSQELIFTIPDKPAPVDPTVLGEPSLESLGLASYWPAGRLQCGLEWVS